MEATGTSHRISDVNSAPLSQLAVAADVNSAPLGQSEAAAAPLSQSEVAAAVDFLLPFQMCAEPKIDGASAAVRYERGVLTRCVSRGDGETGEDVTQQLAGCTGVPLTLTGDPGTWPEVLEVRGEVHIRNADFDAANAARELKGLRLFKSARNAAAGAMRRLERPAGDGTDAGPLRFLAYSWGEVRMAAMQSSSAAATAGIASPENGGDDDLSLANRRQLRSSQPISSGELQGNGGDDDLSLANIRQLRSSQPISSDELHDNAHEAPPWPSQSAFLAALPAWGLSPVPTLAVSDSTCVLMAAHAQLAARRDALGYHVDGVVYKVDDTCLQLRLGSDSRAPRWATAHKFPAETAVTTLVAVDVQVGRTGALTPVALLHPPVTLGGATVSRATLHNFGDIARKGLTVGARVVVERAGDVIPRVVGLAGSAGWDGDDPPEAASVGVAAAAAAPTCCPACGSAVRRSPLGAASRSRPGSPKKKRGNVGKGSNDRERLATAMEEDGAVQAAAVGNDVGIDGVAPDAAHVDETGRAEAAECGDDLVAGKEDEEIEAAAEEAAVLRCTGGLKCPAQAVERIVHFVSRDALDIRGLARQQIQQLHDAGVVSSPADLFTLKARFQHLGVDPDAAVDPAAAADPDAPTDRDLRTPTAAATTAEPARDEADSDPELPAFWLYTSGKDKVWDPL